MTRIRANQEYRNKVGNRIKQHLFQEDTHEKQTYDQLKADQIQLNDDAWKMAKKIVRRHYTEDDVAKAYSYFSMMVNILEPLCYPRVSKNMKTEIPLTQSVPHVA